MDNEQLLTNGICPKCYRPLYESKHTDKVVCDCGIHLKSMNNTQSLKETTDKLKEIRRRVLNDPKNRISEQPKKNHIEFTETVINQIQSETYQLGRDEVIQPENAWSLPDVLAKLIEASEILMHEKDYDGHGYEQILTCIIRGKELLTSLKEKK